MKLHLGKLLTLAAVALLVASCTLETSDNGKLDGMWHLNRVDTIATGGSADLMDAHRYWAIQGKMITARDLDVSLEEIILRFSHDGSTLTVSDPYRAVEQGLDTLLTSPADLAPWGISALSDTFNILQLKSGRMRLESRTLRLYFNKL